MHKIFIIEDDPILAKIYSRKIESEGYQVEIANRGEEGYKRIKTFKPDLLLLDMMLPEMDGADILVMLRGNDDFRDLPIIAYSSSEKILEDALYYGATRVLSKGEFTPDQIVARITEEIARKMEKEKPEPVYEFQSTDVWVHPKGKVLVVEDDPVISTLVKDVIEEENFSVVIANDGREAYKILEKEGNFVAGIFDEKIPWIHGSDLIRFMKEEKRLKDIPVLIMSSEQNLQAQATFISSGAALFIPKPFTRNSLRTVFKTILK
ncbi:MAG: response regulator [Pyrinomonadaceae bacterium]